MATPKARPQSFQGLTSYLRYSQQEAQAMRPQSQHRLSTTPNTPTGVPIRHATTRLHSHSVSLGALNPSHRVTRRKSINTSSANANAVRAALNEFHENGLGNMDRTSFNARNQRPTQNLARGASHGQNHLGVDSSYDDFAIGGHGDESAIAEGFAPPDRANNVSKQRARRASEGSHLTKGDSKRSSGELRCEKCGKGYKHSSCLTKHLWEHDPAWAYTSKLLISKHQQVQLLEAASVLVNMNQEEPSTSENLKTPDSDVSSSSPAASGLSDPRYDDDEYSSAETTPPPMSEQYAMPDSVDAGTRKRYSGISSSCSRSYQSAPLNSLPAGSIFPQYPSQRRPSTSGLTAGMTDEEEAGLAAAVASLCNFGTPRTGPVLLPPDVPPVPPLPAQYVEQHRRTRSGNLMAQSDWGLPSPSYQPLSSERDVRMGDEHSTNDRDEHENDDRSVSNYGKSDEDEGVFGGMEGIAQEAHQELSHA